MWTTLPTIGWYPYNRLAAGVTDLATPEGASR
jgi:hypothetical protein